MRSRTIVIKSKYLLFIFVLSIVFFMCSLYSKYNQNNIINVQESVFENNEIKKVEQKGYKKLEPYKSMPQQLEGYEVIGKLEIPKINLTTYILSETNKSTLKVSVTKLCGPKINGVGNFCIAGHNYNNSNMFKDLKKLEKEDKIYVTDIYDNKVTYVVYDIYKVFPKEVECLSQETDGEREVTLITCTKGAVKRLIIKAVEVYD